MPKPIIHNTLFADLLHCSEVKMLPAASTFKRAQKIAPAEESQPGLGV